MSHTSINRFIWSNQSLTYQPFFHRLGWVENTDIFSPCFNLKWTAARREGGERSVTKSYGRVITIDWIGTLKLTLKLGEMGLEVHSQLQIIRFHFSKIKLLTTFANRLPLQERSALRNLRPARRGWGVQYIPF